MDSADDRSTPPDPRNSEIMSTNSKKSGSGATKVSFSLAPKASARCMPVNSDDQEKVEYLNEFDPNKSVAFNIKVIPKLENSWRPQKNVQMKDDDSQLKFEAEVQPTGIEPDTQYGLNLRSRVSVPNDSHENGKINIQEAFLSKEELEKWKLRKDLEGLPDVASVEDYIKMPVEDFGEALLRGMGWTEGAAIGLNAKEPVMPYECIRRVGRLGLGATPRKP